MKFVRDSSLEKLLSVVLKTDDPTYDVFSLLEDIGSGSNIPEVKRRLEIVQNRDWYESHEYNVTNDAAGSA